MNANSKIALTVLLDSDPTIIAEERRLFSALITGVSAPTVPILDGRMLINRKDAAKLLGCAPITVWRLTRTKLLPSCEQGKRKRYRVADIMDFIARGNHRDN